MQKISPNYSLADVRKLMYYYTDPAHLERRIDAMRKAGLKWKQVTYKESPFI